ncbi:MULTISPECIES: DNA-directed RNA polymerase subunit omega [Alteribacillus]|uniref:DNA-directed RNA polymerase subunit omega n=1 Tax=Alteribacillus bidgolensis TaxID=930129 RepID=A0A1G8GCG3_9BACI|nr:MULTISPECIES: DNA-directed RNA polymerase subunit omega [Alteribacillus]SDH91981.1 DNA-directed RNA polymerase subunit omega [Alteribacillus bidgolensis]
MLYPSIDTLMKHIDSKYTLVTISARRARDLKEMEEADPLIDDYESSKLVGIALEEIEHGKLGYKHTEGS